MHVGIVHVVISGFADPLIIRSVKYGSSLCGIARDGSSLIVHPRWPFLKFFLVNETFFIYYDVLGYCFIDADYGCGYTGQRQAGA